MTTPEEQYDRIFDIYDAIPLTGVSLLTGANGSGKSFVRKVLAVRVNKELKKGKLVHSSQELRTGSFSELGAFSGFARDLPWLPTSQSTLSLIDSLPTEDSYLVLDELEIGFSEETIMALVDYLNEWLATCKAVGVLVITHNRYVAEHLKHDHFFNLDGYATLQEWLGRELVPTNLDDLRENKLFEYIRDITKDQNEREFDRDQKKRKRKRKKKT
jgi:ABC-type multidrug transport system ATPase subunit